MNKLKSQLASTAQEALYSAVQILADEASQGFEGDEDDVDIAEAASFLFMMADQDEDGALDSKDLTTVLETFEIDLNTMAADLFIGFSDRDGDGEIDAEEWEDFVDFCEAAAEFGEAFGDFMD